MAKTKTSHEIAVEAAANLVTLGMEVPAELQARIDAGASDVAFHHLSEKVILPLADDKDNAAGRKARNTLCTTWQERLFALAADVDSDFRSDTKAVGRGHQVERFVSLDSPNGTLVVRLRQDVPTETTTETS